MLLPEPFETIGHYALLAGQTVVTICVVVPVALLGASLRAWSERGWERP